jgi:hypothetical protein
VVVVDGLLGQVRQHLLFPAPGHDGLQLLMDSNLVFVGRVCQGGDWVSRPTAVQCVDAQQH